MTPLLLLLASQFASCHDRSLRIINGDESTIDQFPYLLSLEKYGTHVCGASLIATRVALTAAHCTHRTAPTAFAVRAGSTTRSVGGRVIKVSRVHAHPNYTVESHNFDVSVLALKSKIKYDKTVRPIVLANHTDPLYYKGSAKVAGWGVLRAESSSLPLTLHSVVVEAMTHANCTRAYADIQTPITKQMICFRAKDSKQDSCQGDSGGPIVTEDKQIGIVSWGISCGENEYPGVYSKIGSFRSFIDKYVACILINACG